MAPLPISCFIITKNEADRVGRTIASVRALVAEVIVVDSGSTDGTQDIAAAAGARIIHNTWPGFGQQKRFAEDQCQHDWVINLDADEIVSPELATEIMGAFVAGAPSVAAFWINDHIVYPGWTAPRRFARDHRFVRLYNRQKVRFADSTLFDNVVLGDAPAAALKNPLYHFTVRSLDDLIAKCDERARYNAAFAKKKAKPVLALRLLTEFPLSFFKYYVWRTHIFGGLMGFQYAMIMAFYRFIRIVRMYNGQTTANSGAAVDLNSSRAPLAAHTPVKTAPSGTPHNTTVS